MPMSSAEIAQMNGAFTQASMNRMSYASAIGQGAIYGGQNGGGGDAMMGGAMNRASSIGGPMLSGAMGLMGLDPMSLGLRAGMSAFGAGAGLGGAAMAGGAVALPLMAAGAAINYGAQQMYAGAGQQMDLNQTLRGSYNFRNQHGGAGFNRGDMTQVGGMMRGMVEQFGPGGEITSMGELTQLAGKMSTMGLAQGVRDVQEFSRRFKDMVGTLKTMAKDLGTTLEGAMEFAAAAKQSGVFGMAHVGRFTGAVRSASVAGGIAMSEVTGAASIGSQISRSVGGLGSQGAMAGIRTIGQIGTAQQMGVLSEEDIYNATGLTGAEGRQAFASSQMQRAGSWLQSGRGRRMLASVAGKNGTLDESAVQQIMTGGMGIAETMASDRSHTTGAGGIGRANFIRNEGRLRGAAMARFGAFLPAMQLQEWAGSKGINIQEMDDRSMLFAQRQLGMGRDELDAAVKMANNMPNIMREMQQSDRQDNYFQGLAQQRKMQGVSGVKQRYEQAREIVNNKLQKVGQDVFNSGSEAIDSFLNSLFGSYVETYGSDINDLQRQLMMGGGTSARAGRQLGLGAQNRSRFAGAGAGFGLSGTAGGDFASQMRRGVSGNFEESVVSGFNKQNNQFNFGAAGALGGGLAWVLAGESGVSQMKRAGFDLSGMSSTQMQAKLSSISNSRLAYSNSGAMELSAETRAKVRSAYVFGVGGAGDDRVVAIQSALEQADPELAAKLRRAKTPQEKAALIGQIERGAGIGEGSSLSGNYNTPGGIPGVTSPGGFGSVSEENKAWAQAMGVQSTASPGERAIARSLRGYASGGAGALLGPAAFLKIGGKSLATRAGDMAAELVGKATGSWQTEQDAGEFYKGSGFREMAIGLTSSDPAERARAREAIQQQATDVGEKGKNFNELKGMLVAADAVDALERTGGDKSKMTDLEKRKVEAATRGGSLGRIAGAVNAQQQREQREIRKRYQAQGQADLDHMAVAGVYDAATGTLTSATYNNSKLSESTRDLIDKAIGISKAQAAGDLGGAVARSDEWWETTSNLSRKTRLDLQAGLAGTGRGAELGYVNALESRLGREKRGGLKGILNQELGLGLSAKEMANMTPEGLAAMAGVTDPEQIKKVQMAFKSGDMFKTAQTLEVLQQDKGVKAKHDAASRAAAEERDPFGADQVKEAKKMNVYLEALVKSNKTASLELEKIAHRGDGNPENPPGFGTGTGTKH
jgi:hypothetical protein